LLIDGKPSFVTLEDAWKDNAKQVSCIPTGTYKIVRHKSPRFGKTYKVLDVPDRSEILIHAGNTHEDTQGCILVGLMFGVLGAQTAILSSRTAFEALMNELKDVKEAELEIV
jgi:hypothetical protein